MLSKTDIRVPLGAAFAERVVALRGGEGLFVVATVAVIGLVLSIVAAAFTQDWSQPVAFLGLE
jgi:hypothetical protein